MQKLYLILALAISFNICQVLLLAQTTEPRRKPQESSVSNQQIVELPPPNRSFRPKLRMERALQIAENYAKREKIDLSHYFLYEAKLISYGSEESKKESRWFFWWVSEDGALGKYVQLTVTMDGKVSIIPSM